MSGGSMNYLYSKIECDATFERNTPERQAFADHLQKVAQALHDIEWVDSGDYGPGDENEAICACLSDGATLGAAVNQSLAAMLILGDQVDQVRNALLRLAETAPHAT